MQFPLIQSLNIDIPLFIHSRLFSLTLFLSKFFFVSPYTLCPYMYVDIYPYLFVCGNVSICEQKATAWSNSNRLPIPNIKRSRKFFQHFFFFAFICTQQEYQLNPYHLKIKLNKEKKMLQMRGRKEMMREMSHHWGLAWRKEIMIIEEEKQQI